MKTLRAVLFLATASAALACGSASEPDTTPPITAKAKVEISIASVTLADDCGSPPIEPPPEPEQLAQAPAAPPAGSMAKGASLAMDEAMGDRGCEQSSIQLRVANHTGAASKVVIQKIELLDGDGAKVGELTPRDPSKWNDSAYEAWDEQVAASATMSVSYALSAPQVWRGATYTVRVTVAADGGAHTLEQPVTLHAEASLPPGVVT